MHQSYEQKHIFFIVEKNLSPAKIQWVLSCPVNWNHHYFVDYNKSEEISISHITILSKYISFLQLDLN